MNKSDREALLSQWIKPSSDSEQGQQDRAERMVRDAITAHPAFKGTSLAVYPKGSYPNNTNVRQDSDVDIVVECTECIYYDSGSDVAPPVKMSAYTGSWTPTTWRTEIQKAVVNKLGSAGVDASGNIAIKIEAVAGSRPSVDVVPSFTFRRYWSADGTWYSVGTKVFKKDGGDIINWPQQQLDNGRTKNTATNQRYKNYVRALKNAENVLCASGTISDLPSYLMECLVFNVDDATLRSGGLDDGFRAALVALWEGLEDNGGHGKWLEPNKLKWLFRSSQPWTVAGARRLALKTWQYLGYGG